MEIERNEIVYNELKIKNLAQLSYSIFQDEYVIDNEETANDCLKYLLENLVNIYDFIDTINEDDNTLSDTQNEYLNNVDLYQLGDIINFIQTIKIKKVGKK